MDVAVTAPLSVEAWLQLIKTARGHEGNHLAAFDIAVQALAVHPESLAIHYQAILALARAGSLGGARARYDSLAASGRLAGIADQKLGLDFASLDGRLWKDRAWRARGHAAMKFFRNAAAAYQAAYAAFKDYFPAINAAAMYLAAGNRRMSLKYASIALQLARASSPKDYWSLATEAESQLILGHPSECAEILHAAAKASEDLDELASTRRQLTWIAERTGAPPGTLDALPMPRILNWDSGASAGAANFNFGGRSVLAFGPLMTAADLAIAQGLLRAGLRELTLVLPCEKTLLQERLFSAPGLDESFRGIFADPEVRIVLVTDEGAPREPAATALCQLQARGLALLSARSHLAVPEFVVHGTEGVMFTALPTAPGFADLPEGDCGAELARKPHAIIFGDVRGFSKLNETQQLAFLDNVIGDFGKALKRFDAREYAETAGDGIFVVFSDILQAAECCFALRAALPKAAAKGGLPPDLGIRLSAHVGPLYRRFDRVIRRYKFCGMEVIRTARIEPVTPVGEIYVTEQFAAALAGIAADDYVCEYAGLQPMAKNFGHCRMYALRRAQE